MGFLGKPSGKAERPLKPHLLFFLDKKKVSKKHLTRPSDTLSNRRGKEE
jgi:hypothetical protein